MAAQEAEPGSMLHHYRSVLATPDGSDHGNIRALQTQGLAGVRFSQAALQRNA